MRIGLVTIGCDKNAVDNEYLAGLLEERGHEAFAAGEGPEEMPEANPANAAADTSAAGGAPDVVIITTCGFLDATRQQSVEVIERWIALRRALGGVKPRVGVIGCLSQRMGENLRRQIPGIDFLAGVAQFDRVVRLIEAHECPAGAVIPPPPRVEIPRIMPRKRLEKTPHSYLKISDGCNHSCSFCSIPLMKGRLCSVPRPVLVEEARRLVAGGVREINLVAQDTSAYGLDTEGRPALAELLEELAAVPGDFWIRIFYLYPTTITDRLIEVVAREPKIVKYLDIPLQHLDEGILRSMRRPHDAARSLDLIRRMREAIPGLVLRTTFIVGFPGETERAFRNLLAGIEEIAFERMGAFLFSPEPGTPAMDMPNAVDAKRAAKRFDRLMRLQAEISAQWCASQIGSRRRVLIECADSERPGCWIGRSYSEAPDVDGFVRVRSGKGETQAGRESRTTENVQSAESASSEKTIFAPGEFVDVLIDRADIYDLEGRLAPKEKT